MSDIDREVLCADLRITGLTNPVDILMQLIAEDGVGKKLNQDKLLFSHFTHIGIGVSGTSTYILLSNKKINNS